MGCRDIRRMVDIHQAVTMCDGCDDIYDSGCGAENKMQRVSLCFSCGL